MHGYGSIHQSEDSGGKPPTPFTSSGLIHYPELSSSTQLQRGDRGRRRRRRPRRSATRLEAFLIQFHARREEFFCYPVALVLTMFLIVGGIALLLGNALFAIWSLVQAPQSLFSDLACQREVAAWLLIFAVLSLFNLLDALFASPPSRMPVPLGGRGESTAAATAAAGRILQFLFFAWLLYGFYLAHTSAEKWAEECRAANDPRFLLDLLRLITYTLVLGWSGAVSLLITVSVFTFGAALPLFVESFSRVVASRILGEGEEEDIDLPSYAGYA